MKRLHRVIILSLFLGTITVLMPLSSRSNTVDPGIQIGDKTIYPIRFGKDSLLLSDMVNDFNGAASFIPQGKDQTPLTADEIVAAIHAWDRSLHPVADPTYAVLEQIADTQKLPKDSELRLQTSMVINGYLIDLWKIELRVPVDIVKSPNLPDEYGWCPLLIRERKVKSRLLTQEERERIEGQEKHPIN